MYNTELIFILIPFFIAALLCITVKNRRLIEISSLIASGISLLGSIIVSFRVAYFGVYAPFPFFSVDSLDAVVMLIIAFVGLATTVYSIEYLRQETTKNIIGLSGVSYLSSRVREYFILLNIFMEATTLSTAFLISFYNKPSAIEGAWKYLIINSIGILLAFFGTLLFFSSTGSLACD